MRITAFHARSKILVALIVILSQFVNIAEGQDASSTSSGGDNGSNDDTDCDVPTQYRSHGPIIAVTSCTGFVGSRVVRSLRRAGVSSGDIRCLVHRGTTKNVNSLADLEDVRYVDFMDTSSVAEALRGTSMIYVNTPQSDNVLAMRSNIAHAIHEAGGIRHIVALGEPADVSWYGLSKYWDDHRSGLSELERLGIPLTILQPSWFLDLFPGIVAHDKFQRVGTKPSPYSSVDDVADVTAAILRDGPIKHGWKRYSLINALLTGDEIAQAMTEARGGITTTYVPITLDDFWHGMVDHVHTGEVAAEGFTKAMGMNDAGAYSRDDLGQLRLLLGRRPREAVEVFSDMRHFFNRADRQQKRQQEHQEHSKGDGQEESEEIPTDGDKNTSSLGYNEASTSSNVGISNSKNDKAAIQEAATAERSSGGRSE